MNGRRIVMDALDLLTRISGVDEGEIFLEDSPYLRIGFTSEDYGNGPVAGDSDL